MLKRFGEYVKIRENDEMAALPSPEMGGNRVPSPLDKNGGMPRFDDKGMKDDEEKDMPALSDDKMAEVFKVAWRKHRDKVQELLQDLAKEDEEIKRTMEGGESDGPESHFGNSNKDEVVPPEADGSPGLDEE
jgi:hypothetical protein